MSTSQPEANTEYSTAVRASGPSGGRPRGVRVTALVLAAIGAGLLAVAEFSPLLRVRTAAPHSRLVRTVTGGPHHGWALLVLALLAALLILRVARAERPGPVWGLIAVAGVAALAITLLVDLPDAHATGIVGSPAGGLRDAAAHAAIGLYLETLGATLLLLAAGAALLLGRRGETR